MIDMEATLAELRRLLDLAGTRERTAFILPSTASLLDFARRESHSDRIAVLSPSLGERQCLSTFLARIADVDRALVFSDQLTSARDAPWLIEWQGERRYMSRVEYLLQRELDFRTCAWTLTGFRFAPHGCGEKAFARMLQAYLVSCDGLGERWLARKQQIHRLPSERRDALISKLQLFRSSALAASTEAAPSDELRRVLQRLDQLFDALRTVR